MQGMQGLRDPETKVFRWCNCRRALPPSHRDRRALYRVKYLPMYLALRTELTDDLAWAQLGHAGHCSPHPGAFKSF